MDYWIPLLWLLLAVALIVIEATTFNLITIWFAIGAIGAMFVSIPLPENYILQGIVFVLLSFIMLVTIRNFAIKRLKGKTIKTNVNALIGKKGIVTKTIEPYKFGEVKLEGNYWTTKSENDDIIEVNSVVEIVEISGVKLVVRKIN